MYPQFSIVVSLVGILIVLLALCSNYILDLNWWKLKWFYKDIVAYLKTLLRPKPEVLKYNYMSKNESKKWKECEYCFRWGEPEKFKWTSRHGGQLVLDICKFCGKEFKSYSKTYYQPDEKCSLFVEIKDNKYPKEKVKIEIEEITEDPRNI